MIARNNTLLTILAIAFSISHNYVLAQCMPSIIDYKKPSIHNTKQGKGFKLIRKNNKHLSLLVEKEWYNSNLILEMKVSFPPTLREEISTNAVFDRQFYNNQKGLKSPRYLFRQEYRDSDILHYRIDPSSKEECLALEKRVINIDSSYSQTYLIYDNECSEAEYRCTNQIYSDKNFLHNDTLIHERYAETEIEADTIKELPIEVNRTFQSFDTIKNVNVSLNDKTTSYEDRKEIKYSRIRILKLDSLDRKGRVILSKIRKQTGKEIYDVFEKSSTTIRRTKYKRREISAIVLDEDSRDTLNVITRRIDKRGRMLKSRNSRFKNGKLHYVIEFENRYKGNYQIFSRIEVFSEQEFLRSKKTCNWYYSKKN